MSLSNRSVTRPHQWFRISKSTSAVCITSLILRAGWYHQKAITAFNARSIQTMANSSRKQNHKSDDEWYANYASIESHAQFFPLVWKTFNCAKSFEEQSWFAAIEKQMCCIDSWNYLPTAENISKHSDYWVFEKFVSTSSNASLKLLECLQFFRIHSFTWNMVLGPEQRTAFQSIALVHLMWVWVNE